ncbi:MAG TPA: GAF domain-containing protein [Nannocystis exedens]|nr:GAF domain-containing protein [Nannocystis exedens]
MRCDIVAPMSGQSDDHPRTGTEAHLAEFFGRGEAFARQLIAENERLRQELASSKGNGSLATSVLSSGAVEELVARVSQLESQQGRRDPEPAVEPAELGDLRERNAALSAEIEELKSGAERLEGENYHLATLYIVLQQLHSARVLGDVVQTLTEVCLNFIGVGGFSLYIVDEERQLAFPLVREGASIDELEERPLADEGPLAAIANLGRAWQGGDPIPHEFDVLMYLPLCSGPRLVGVITLEAYLPQKSALTEDDYAVLAMLSEHGGIGLETVWIRAHATPTPLTRRAIEALLEA